MTVMTIEKVVVGDLLKPTTMTTMPLATTCGLRLQAENASDDR